MSSDHDPNWDLLPHNPEGFFGLGTEFDRKDLKRSYSKLIRRFKPEKFPREFQRIREAYDEIDRRLRYGRSAETPFVTVIGNTNELTGEQKQQIERLISQMAADRESAAAQRKTLLASLEETEPEGLYRRLKASKERTATDYLFLAFLSDVYDERPLAFLQWLLAGLKEYPRANELSALVQEYLRHPPKQYLPRILKAVARGVPNDGFYFLTEALWQNLLDETEFEAFAALLEECEDRLRDHRIRGKLVFYVQILRKAMWFAHPAWIRQALKFINENQMEIAEQLEYDLHVNDMLLEYIKIRGDFLNGNPVRQEIDQTIYRYCVMDDLPAMNEYIATQQRLVRAVDELKAAFPISEMPYNPIYEPWCWISQEIESRVGHERREMTARDLAPRVERLLADIDDQTGGLTGLKWKAYDWLVYGMLALLVLVLPGGVWWLCAATLKPPGGNAAGFLLGAVLAIANWNYTFPWLNKLLRTNVCLRLAMNTYHNVWREELFDFLKLSLVPIEDVLRLVEAFELDERTADRFQYIHWVSLFLQQDFGLAFFSLAQQYQK